MDNYYTNNSLLIDPSRLHSNDSSLTGESAWSAPSNLALVKYWGKRPGQLPQNRSISITLDGATTRLHLAWKPKKEDSAKTGSDKIELLYRFHEKENIKFATRVHRYLETLLPVFPFLEQFTLMINSENSFPHSAGIASSASSMSGLALALCSMEQQLFNLTTSDDNFFAKASYLARLGSGSAARSLYPGVVEWGGGEQSDYFASPITNIDPSFLTMKDAILMVSGKAKPLSSSEGHLLMEQHPFATARYQQANSNCQKILKALQQGDWHTFGEIVEQEAMTLHSLMMSSGTGHILIKPETLTLIEKIRHYRGQSGQQLYFTLDAGPNLHLLYPKDSYLAVKTWIEQELAQYLESGEWIDDQVGSGPFRI
jgi:diphosphomevalonate decarboxylase